MANPRVGSVQAELLGKSREAALNAVQTFNNPLTTFKTETFIVLMVIAWMYLLHSYYWRAGVDYRYYDQGPKRRRFHRTKSEAYKYWELERRLNEKRCPLDPATKVNLHFLIGLRHEIEHYGSAGVDDHFTGRYFACCLNYERAIVALYGQRYSLGSALSFTLQFRDFTRAVRPDEALDPLPSNVAKYLQEFDAELSDDQIRSPYFRRKFLFVPVVTSKRGQADQVLEFVSPDSDLGQAINENYQVYLKEVERPKQSPGEIVKLMQSEGYQRFNIYNHTQLWKTMNAKRPGKGYGVDVAGRWLWYDRWVEVVRKHCSDNAQLYGSAPGLEAAS